MIELCEVAANTRSEWPLCEEPEARTGPFLSGPIAFGPFRLVPAERLLLKSGEPVPLGSRALDILIALVERPGEMISKTELMARVWPSVNVVDANLTVHMTALRHALADGQDGHRYIVTIPGRGYCFVASVTHEPRTLAAGEPALASHLRSFIRPLLGRLDVIIPLAASVPRQRLVTIIGPGGVGKTSVAVAIGDLLTPVFTSGVFIADLGNLSALQLIPAAFTSALRLAPSAKRTAPRLASELEENATLLILDNCDHVIDGAAALIADLLRLAPGLHVLATSREPLRFDGERLCRLSGLETPPDDDFLSASDALAFPSVQLFVEHATERWGEFDLDDFDAPDVAQICRRLDGNPLAIKLAATHLGTLGIRGLLDWLGDRFSLLTGGDRGSTLRHRSMLASMMWQYELLTDVEKSILQRLSIFDDRFTLREACEFAHSGCPDHELMDIVRDLTEKSLILVESTKLEPLFRLSETTRLIIRRECEKSRTDCAIHHGPWTARKSLERREDKPQRLYRREAGNA
jgi:predicted ATPase/DNA-binding winged helix-turn-helix (wHTH) protein